MSYKVNSIITPFCRNLLAPAMALAFFVTSDDGLPGSCYKRAKKAMVASNWPQVDTGRLFPHWLRNFLAWCESFVTPDLSLSDVTCPHGKSSSIVFVKGKEQWHISSNEIANRFLKRATADPRADSTWWYSWQIQPVVSVQSSGTGLGAYCVCLNSCKWKPQDVQMHWVALRNSHALFSCSSPCRCCTSRSHWCSEWPLARK